MGTLTNQKKHQKWPKTPLYFAKPHFNIGNDQKARNPRVPPYQNPQNPQNPRVPPYFLEIFLLKMLNWSQNQQNTKINKGEDAGGAALAKQAKINKNSQK